MKTFPIRDLSRNVAAVTQTAHHGEPVLITRQGKPYCKILPVEELSFLGSAPGGAPLPNNLDEPAASADIWDVERT